MSTAFGHATETTGVESSARSMIEPPPRRPAWRFGSLSLGDQRVIGGALAVALAALAGGWFAQWRGWRNLNHASAVHAPAAFVVDLNTAAWHELILLPDIGETLAKRIVESRERDGAFASVDDLDRVRGIGAATVERLRPFARCETKAGDSIYTAN